MVTVHDRALGLSAVTHSLPAAEAADLLNVECSTLYAWERLFGFPRSMDKDDRSPRYLATELCALQRALQHAPSLAAAIREARVACRTPDRVPDTPL